MRTVQAATFRGLRSKGLRFLLIGYMAGIFAFSHMSRPPLPTPLFRLSDKVLHVAEYLPLGLLWTAALGPRPGAPWVGWLTATLFGASDEFHQAFVPGRDASLLDLGADGLGAALGASLARWRRRR